MKKIFIFNFGYFIFSIILLFIIVAIALFLNDSFIRPFVGDALIVAWIYTLLKSFLSTHFYTLSLFILLFAFSVEVAQLFKLVEFLNIEHIKAAKIIIGATFDWWDFLAYTIGWIAIITIESLRSRSKTTTKNH